MRFDWRRRAMAVVVFALALCPLALDAHPAVAFPDGDPVFAFSFKVDAVTHVKKFDQTINVPGGTFVGGIDLMDGSLEGTLALPTTEFTFTEVGIGLVTATAKIVPTQPVTGMVDFFHLPDLPLTATAVFKIRIINAHLPGSSLNLVGDWCQTASPVSVTMSGMANLATTTALSLAISGPGNTFTATATPG